MNITDSNNTFNIEAYLRSSEIIDWQNPGILELAHQLKSTHQTTEAIAQACFEWVRDEIHHSFDYEMNPVTCKASDVLKYKTGYCFAKSHLLAALLRANQIPAGLCYQRLSIDNPTESQLLSNNTPCTLHGLNAILLPKFGWYRVDARGNRHGVNAQFIPPQEQLAFELKLPQEVDFKTIFAEPLNIILDVLQTSKTWNEVLLHLPDISPEKWQHY
jgi:transglutaminase-like putative cysteine protease